jgi:hypothetical protein
MEYAMNDNDVHEFPCTGPIRADVRVRAGVITVTAEDRHTASVRVMPHDNSDASAAAAEETTVTFDDGRLRVEMPESDRSGWILRRSGRVRVDLRVPLDSRLAAYSGSADVHTTGRLGTATVRTGSGDVYVNEIDGDLTVDSGSGDVRVDLVGGALGVKTGSGDVRVIMTRGPMTAQVASGDVAVDHAAGAVRVSTASGDVRVGAAGGDQVQIKAASGDVSVGVPVGTKVWLDLSTLSGSTTTDLQVSGSAPPSDVQLNVRIHTLSGDIHLHRVGKPASDAAA